MFCRIELCEAQCCLPKQPHSFQRVSSLTYEAPVADLNLARFVCYKSSFNGCSQSNVASIGTVSHWTLASCQGRRDGETETSLDVSQTRHTSRLQVGIKDAWLDSCQHLTRATELNAAGCETKMSWLWLVRHIVVLMILISSRTGYSDIV